MKKIDIVVPILNEAKVLEDTLAKLVKYCEVNFADYKWKIIVGDCGSWDGSPEVVREIMKNDSRVGYYNTGIPGRGRVLDYLWSHSSADYICYTDADLTIQVSHLAEMVERLEKGADFVVGSRNIKGSVSVNRGFKRVLFSKIYIAMIRMYLGVNFTDAQCGFKGARAQSYKKIADYIDDQSWFWDTEMLVLAEKIGMKIEEIPVTCIYGDSTTVNVSKTAKLDLIGLLRLKVSKTWERIGSKDRKV